MRIFTISNGLSAFRMLLVIPALLLLSEPYSNRMMLFGIAVLAYATDILDGYIARQFGDESTFGRIIDPLADKVLVIGVVLGLLFADLLPLWFVVVVVARDAVIFLAGIHLKNKTGILAQSNATGKAAVVSIALVIVLSLFQDTISRTFFTLLLITSLGLMTASLTVYGQRFFKLMKTTA